MMTYNHYQPGGSHDVIVCRLRLTDSEEPSFKCTGSWRCPKAWNHTEEIEACHKVIQYFFRLKIIRYKFKHNSSLKANVILSVSFLNVEH